MSTTLRAIDPTIASAVRAAPPQKNGYVATRPIADALGISHEYLRSRLRQMRASGALSDSSCAKVRWSKPQVDTDRVIAAWETSTTVTEAARRVDLSRSGILQRVEKIRAEVVDGTVDLRYPDLRERPHMARSKADHQAELHERVAAASTPTTGR